jgi:hypothetical protein
MGTVGRPVKVAVVVAGRPERVPVLAVPPTANVTVPVGVKSLPAVGVTVAVKVQVVQSPAWLALSDSVVEGSVAAGNAPAADHAVAATTTVKPRPTPRAAAAMPLVNPAPGLTPR